jgi:3-deoxy-7-phosphoheptulonate synthase
VVQKLEAEKLPARIMIDCSHGNSSKVFSRQVDVAKDIVSLALSLGNRNV